MRRATFLDSALEDLVEILDYLTKESGSLSGSQSFVRKLREKCYQLAGHKATMGRARAELLAGVRSFPYKRYVIIFRYVDERFEVVRILEGHRDIEASFREQRES